MRHGYWLAASREECGDPEFSRAARFLWLKTGHRSPGRFDGVSVFSHDGMSTDILMVYTDFFADFSTAPHPPKVLAMRGHR